MTQKTILSLEKELQDMKRELFMKQQKEARELKYKKEKEADISISWSDDYFWADVWDFSFYYWYEETFCKKHPNIEDCEDRYDCEWREWCFTACKWDKEVMRIPQSDLWICDTVEEYTMWGIMLFIKKYIH